MPEHMPKAVYNFRIKYTICKTIFKKILREIQPNEGRGNYLSQSTASEAQGADIYNTQARGKKERF